MSPIFIHNTNYLKSNDKLIYLDRDGVLIEPILRNGIVSSARTVAEIKLCNDAIYFCGKLNSAGYTLIVVSNQPDISRGLIDLEFIFQTNNIINKYINIDFYLYCPHQDFEKCLCRKPKPGMINYFRNNYSPTPAKEIMIGDRIVDYECAKSAGINFLLKCQPYSFLGDGKRLLDYQYSFDNLFDASNFINHI
jgi:D-glycero-D-manno-heptose 1,7-bisphosphate phosphatase